MIDVHIRIYNKFDKQQTMEIGWNEAVYLMHQEKRVLGKSA